MTGTYPGEELIARATDLCVEAGVRTLATHYYGSDDRTHAAALLKAMNPPIAARILDAGCGIGEVALQMSRIRPDLHFTLLNVNRHQLSLCPQQFDKVEGDFHATGLEPGQFDVVMFNTAICHAELAPALAEAARLLHRGGKVFVSDVARLSGDNTEIQAILHTRAWRLAEWAEAADAAGLAIMGISSPPGDPVRFRAMLGDSLHDQLFGPLRPVLLTLEFRP